MTVSSFTQRSILYNVERRFLYYYSSVILNLSKNSFFTASIWVTSQSRFAWGFVVSRKRMQRYDFFWYSQNFSKKNSCFYCTFSDCFTKQYSSVCGHIIIYYKDFSAWRILKAVEHFLFPYPSSGKGEDDGESLSGLLWKEGLTSEQTVSWIPSESGTWTAQFSMVLGPP